MLVALIFINIITLIGLFGYIHINYLDGKPINSVVVLVLLAVLFTCVISSGFIYDIEHKQLTCEAVV